MMRGKNAARAATLLALTWVVAPALGDDPFGTAEPEVIGAPEETPGSKEKPVTLDLELGASAGRMPLLRPGGCGGPAVRAASYGGTYGRLGARSRPSSGRWEHRLVGEVSGELRGAVDNSQDLHVTGLGRATVGWSSRYAGLSVGGWGGNVGENEEAFGFFSASVRLGLPDRYLRISVFDQPGCFLGTCMVGADALWTFNDAALHLGVSAGLVGWRGWVQVPVRLGEGLPWIHPGIELGTDENDNALVGLTLGVRLPEL